jgi:hypothetical protein
MEDFMFRKTISSIAVITFICSLVVPVPKAQALGLLGLPDPGTMVLLSPAYEPTLIKGLTVHKDNPFLFDFIVDTGHSQLAGEALKKEGDRLIKYFFAALTIPDRDLWVNLSPYEKDRTIPKALGQTAMGRDLLAQDYMLKQLTASLINPEKELGKKFWDKVYLQARERFGTTKIPVNTFNKVWVVAEKASVYEHRQTAFIVSGHLKVMLEQDYLALQKHTNNPVILSAAKDLKIPLDSSGPKSVAHQNDVNTLASQIVRSIILPAIEHEVNTGKNFATLRQIFYSQILAVWFKRNLKQALLSQVYADKSTVNGVNLQDPSIKERIYQRYLQAYKKGAYNYIKDEIDPVTQQLVPRKYFSGGYDSAQLVIDKASDHSMRNASPATGTDFALTAVLNLNSLMDKAMQVISMTLPRKAELVKGRTPVTLRVDPMLLVIDGEAYPLGIVQGFLESFGRTQIDTPVGKAMDIVIQGLDGIQGVNKADFKYKMVKFLSLHELNLFDNTIVRMVETFNTELMAISHKQFLPGEEYKFKGQRIIVPQVTRIMGQKMESIDLFSLNKVLGILKPEVKAKLSPPSKNHFKANDETRTAFLFLSRILISYNFVIREPVQVIGKPQVDAADDIEVEGTMLQPLLVFLMDLSDVLKMNNEAVSIEFKSPDAAMATEEVIVELKKLNHYSSPFFTEGIWDIVRDYLNGKIDEENAVKEIEYHNKTFIVDLLGFARSMKEGTSYINGAFPVVGSGEAEKISRDPAMNGGIDLNTLNNGLSVSKDANGGVTITVDPAMIERVRREGIRNATPVIINMTFLPSVDQLLGL